MTYKQAYDKIIDAYFKDDIKPNDFNYCVCGTLQGSGEWRKGGKYTKDQYHLIETALFSAFPERYKGSSGWCFDWKIVDTEDCSKSIKDYEEKLFAGMSAALDVLKQIHIDRGEVIDPLPTLTKRVFSDQIKVKI